MPQGLREYGSGFLRGLTNVAQQSRADKRQQEDQDIQNKIAMAQLAISSGDPTLIRSSMDIVNEVLGFGKSGAKGGTGGKKGQDPQSVIAGLFVDPMGGGGDAPPPGQAPGGLRVSTAEQTAARAQVASQQRVVEAGATTGAQTDATREGQIALARRLVQQFGMDPEEAMVRAGAIEPSAGASTTTSTFWAVPKGSIPGTAPTLYLRQGKEIINQDGTPYVGPELVEATPGVDPVDPLLTATREATLTRTQQQIAAGTRTEEAAATATAAQASYDAIPDQYRTLIDSAIAKLPAAAQTSKRQLATERWATGQATGDTQGIERLIRNTVFEDAGAITRRQVEGRDAAIQELTKIEGLFAELATDSVNPDGTVSKGITTGRYTWSKQRGLRWLGRQSDPRLTRLTARIEAAIIAYRAAVSGAAFTESEGKAYEALFPSIGNTAALNASLINGTRTSMQSVNASFWNARLGPEGAALVGAVEGDAPRRLRARQVLMDNNRPADPAAVDRFLQNNSDFR